MGNALNSVSPVQNLLKDNPVMIFSTTTCPFCKVAKNTFNEIGTSYGTVELNKIPPESGKELLQELSQITGSKLVPQVFICETYIGGGTEVRALYRSGKLKKMIENCCHGDVSCDFEELKRKNR